MAKGTNALASDVRESRPNFQCTRDQFPDHPLVLADHSRRERNSIEGGEDQAAGRKSASGRGMGDVRVCVTFKPLAVQVDFYLNEKYQQVSTRAPLPLQYTSSSSESFLSSPVRPVASSSSVSPEPGLFRRAENRRTRGGEISRSAPSPPLRGVTL